MKLAKILVFGSTALAIALLSSCGCCTSDVPAPPLRPAPSFGDGAVSYAK